MEKLSNKQYKSYSRVSRYSGIPYWYNNEDKKYISGTSYHLYDTTVYSLRQVKQGDTLDSLALYYYNNPTYYWIIADFNRIQDPFKELEPGSYLKIPTFSTIEFDKGNN